MPFRRACTSVIDVPSSLGTAYEWDQITSAFVDTCWINTKSSMARNICCLVMNANANDLRLYHHDQRTWGSCFSICLYLFLDYTRVANSLWFFFKRVLVCPPTRFWCFYLPCQVQVQTFSWCSRSCDAKLQRKRFNSKVFYFFKTAIIFIFLFRMWVSGLPVKFFVRRVRQALGTTRDVFRDRTRAKREKASIWPAIQAIQWAQRAQECSLRREWSSHTDRLSL